MLFSPRWVELWSPPVSGVVWLGTQQSSGGGKGPGGWGVMGVADHSAELSGIPGSEASEALAWRDLFTQRDEHVSGSLGTWVRGATASCHLPGCAQNGPLRWWGHCLVL